MGRICKTLYVKRKGTGTSNNPKINASPESKVNPPGRAMDVQCPGEGAQQSAVVNPALRFDVVCRVCGNEDENNVGIFREDGANRGLALKMNAYLPIKVADGDSLPSNCCRDCASLIVSWHKLVALSVETDRKLKKLLVVDAEPLEVRAVSPKVEIEPAAVIPDMDTPAVKEEDEVSIDFRDNIIIEQGDEYTIGTTSSLDSKEEVSQGDETAHLESFLKSEKPTCKVCHKSFSCNSTLSRHVRTLHKGMVVVDDEALYECDVCKKRYSKRHAFSAHRQTHVGESNTCDICGDRFPTARLLRRHHGQNHTTKPFACKVCGARFRARFWLEQHANVHSDERPYACDVCGKAFRQPSTLYLHKRCHGDFQFSCDVCGKGFRRRCYLKRHAAARHARDAPYSCDLCGKSFRLQKALQQHASNHDPLATYPCDVRPVGIFEPSQEES